MKKRHMPSLLTVAKLKKMVPGARKEILQGLVEGQHILAAAGIFKNRRRLCYFLAQAAHETAGFRTLVEYGSVRYFRRRYGHRRDLGNKSAADGARYRGRGIFQLTGRANYRRFGRILRIGLETSPMLAAQPLISVRIAASYWQRHGLNGLADKGKFKAITRKINGGYNGLKDRRVYLRRALRLWQRKDFHSFGDSILFPSVISSRRSGQTLKRGMKGAPVRLLQKHLQRAGFAILRDGVFGSQTQTVLKRFQKKAGLVMDGIAGPATFLALEALLQSLKVPESESVAGRHAKAGPAVSPLSKEGTKSMMSWKNVLQSRAIWSSLVGLAALALGAFGLADLAAESQTQIVDAILKIVEAAGFIGGVVFRLLATDRLTFHGDDLR